MFGEQAPRYGRQEGFSLLEFVVVLTIMTVVFGGAMNVWFKSQVAFTEHMQQHVVNDTGRRVLHRLASELQMADPTTLQPLVVVDSDTIEFNQVLGYDDGIVYGPVLVFGFQLAEGETANGLDDNGDGRFDEGFVTVGTLGEPQVSIAGNILGLRFSTIAGGIVVEVDVGVIDRDGNLFEQTFGRTVSFRNGNN